MRASGRVHIVIRFGPAAHRGLEVDDCPQEAVIKSCEHLSAENGHGELSDSFGRGFLKVISHWDLKKVASFLVAAVPAEPRPCHWSTILTYVSVHIYCASIFMMHPEIVLVQAASIVQR